MEPRIIKCDLLERLAAYLTGGGFIIEEHSSLVFVRFITHGLIVLLLIVCEERGNWGWEWQRRQE